MHKNYSLFKNSWILLLLLISSLSFAQTNTWNGGTGTNAAQRIDWNRAANWSLNLVPIAAHDVVIPTATDQPTISTTSSNAAAVCKSLTINANATLTVGNKNLTVSGATSISGTITFSSTTGVETFTGLVTINDGGLWNNTANEAINFRGGITNNGTFNAGTGVQTFDTNSQVLNGDFVIPSVTVTGNVILTNNDNLTVSIALAGTGRLTNTSTGVLNIGGASSITNLTNQGTLNRTGTGTTTTAIANFTNTGTINLNGSGAITGITNNASGIVNLFNSGTITSFNNATSTSVLNISDLTVPIITTLTTTAPGNTVNYNGEGNQDVKGTSYSNLTTSGSGDKTMTAAVTVNNNLLVGTGTWLIDNDKQITGNANGTLTVQNGGVLQLGSASKNKFGPTTFPTSFTNVNIDLQTGSEVRYNYNGENGGVQTISTVPTYYFLHCQFPGTKRPTSGTLNIKGNFDTASPLDLNTNDPTINLTGDFNLLGVPATVSLTSNVFSIGGNFNNALTSGGSLASGNGTINFNGAGAQSITGGSPIATPFYNLTVSKPSGTLSLTSSNQTVANNLTLTAGTLDLSTYTLNRVSTGGS